MDIKIGFIIVNFLFRLAEWLKLKAVGLNVSLSMRHFKRENGFL